MKSNINYIKQKGKVFKCIYYALVIFSNDIISIIPSRRFRRLTYKLLGAEIDKTTVVFRRTEMIYPYGLSIGKKVSVGSHVLLDARGGIEIGNNVNISGYAKLITGSHNVHSATFEASFLPIIIGDNVWIGTGATILQNVTIGEGAVVAAGAMVSCDVPPYEVWGGVPAKRIGNRCHHLEYSIESIGINTFLH